MIRTFRDPDAKALPQRRRPRRLPACPQYVALREVVILDAADSLADPRVPPGNRLEPLKGGRAGQLSIRVNDPWRICFVSHATDAFDVDIVDYHS